MDLMRRFISRGGAINQHDTEPDFPPDGDSNQLVESEVKSPGSEFSDATTYYDVHYDGPNLPNLPTEIVGMLISNLSRQDIKNLRLVSRDCEAVVSAYFFREVVVPFRSQFYGSLPRNEDGLLTNVSSTTLSNGVRVFDAFGHLIRRFALSLELDEEVLEYPPLKVTQQVHSSFWGLYRWPPGSYTRYSDLSGLENDADELEGMRRALRCLTHVLSLGLCSDAGLGFLSGPNANARHNTIRQRVFPDRNWRKRRILTATPTPAVTVGDAQRASGILPRPAGRVIPNWKSDVLEALVTNADFTQEQMSEAMALLLESENTTLADILFDDTPAPDIPTEPDNSGQNTMLAPFVALGGARTSAIQDPLQRMRIRSLLHGDNMPVPDGPESEGDDFALVPCALTRAQKEMLLEMEWAHRAITQSYILCAIDCAREGCFQYLTTLNIAKIPSSHLHIISRHDFWTSFPNLNTVSLGVVADWRHVYSSTPGFVDDESVSPLKAVPLAHEVICNYISTDPNIESFHFEWICGGELASGCHQRNQHILPAPFYASPESMARRTMDKVGDDPGLLRFPHLKHLSLKNCWVAPHVLLQSLRDYSLCSLEKIEFESVSLSAMPGLGYPNAPPLYLGNLGLPPHPQNPNFSNFTPSEQYWTALPPLQQPSWLSWAGLIEHFSPSVKVRETISKWKTETGRATLEQTRKDMLRALRSIIPDADQLPHEETNYKLESLSFKSCGYITLPHSMFKITQMLPVTNIELLAGTIPMNSAFTPMMQRCKDKLLGRIVAYTMLNDRRPLLDVFRMTMGWDNVYSQTVIESARADGCQKYGQGRFSGVVECCDDLSQLTRFPEAEANFIRRRKKRRTF